MPIQKLIIPLLFITLLNGCGSDSESTPELTDVDEKEFYNDEQGSAQLVPMNSRVSGSLSASSDTTDIYRLKITEGGSITITLTGGTKNDFDIALLSEGFDRTILTEYNESGEGLLAFSYEDDSNEKTSYHINAAGDYYVAVNAFFGSGDYTLSIYGSASSQVIVANDNSEFYYDLIPYDGLPSPFCVQFNKSAYQLASAEQTNSLTSGDCSSSGHEYEGFCPTRDEGVLFYYGEGLHSVCDNF